MARTKINRTKKNLATAVKLDFRRARISSRSQRWEKQPEETDTMRKLAALLLASTLGLSALGAAAYAANPMV
ncbi:hypothetical protein, partial [Mesorhizobium sp.]|uniref:hypothetical protein n=1 Tax=Mesorhizobium sp. TaxID=1871066 RepID=UPI0025FFAB1D